jgi:hypothetical protein
MCLRTAFVALGWIGVILCAALLGTFVWVLLDLKVLHAADSTAMALDRARDRRRDPGVGLSWALIRARTTGQIETQ